MSYKNALCLRARADSRRFGRIFPGGELSRQLVAGALKRCHDNKSKAADLLGVTRNKFYRLLKLHGLDGESPDNGNGESDWID